MRVYQVMTTDPVAVDLDDDLEDAFELMHMHALDELPVLEDGRLVGVVTEQALAEELAQEDRDAVIDGRPTLAMLMTHNVAVCSASTSVSAAGAAMDSHGVEQIYVTTSDGRLVGVVEDVDLVDWYGDGDADAEVYAWLPQVRHAHNHAEEAPPAGI